MPQADEPLTDAELDFALHSVHRSRKQRSDHATGLDPAALLGGEFAGFKIRERLGEGAMGLVFLAEQPNPQRDVALKVMKAVLSSSSQRRRFENEAQILGRLQHPAIAQVYAVDSVVQANGVAIPYIALELIPGGRRLDEYAEQEDLSTRERLELFVAVCNGVEHGHQRGVVHRDLKPGNILVSADGQPKIIDFGIARAVDHDATSLSMHTRTGQMLGTPQFMSPEQFAGSTEIVDTRSDVYALGVILHHLLTGQFPFEHRGRPLLEVARLVRETPARKPSTFVPTLRGDLDAIVMRALEADPDRRYASAGALADDVRRHLSGVPVEARPVSTAYQLRLLARRNKALVAGVAAVLLVSLVGAGVSLYFAGEARQQNANALANLEVAQRSSYELGIFAAHRHIREGDAPRAKQLLAAMPERLREWEWHHLNATTDQSVLAFEKLPAIASSLAYSPDGRRLLAGFSDGRFRIHDTTSWRQLTAGQVAEPILTGALADDGDFVLGSPEGSLWIGRATKAPQTPARLLRKLPSRLHELVSVPGKRRLYVALANGSVLRLDPDRQPIEIGRFHYSSSLRLRPGSEELVHVDGYGYVRVLEGTTGRVRATYRDHGKFAALVAALSHDGRLLATGGNDQHVVIRDLESGEQRARFHAHRGNVLDLAFGPGDRWLATGGGDRAVRVFDLSGTNLTTLPGHAKEVHRIAVAPDGNLVSASHDFSMRIWGPRPGLDRIEIEQPGLDPIAISPDGSLLAVGSFTSYDTNIRLFDLRTDRLVTTLHGHTWSLQALAFSADGTRLASTGADRVVKLWDVVSGRELAESAVYEADIRGLAFSPDGSRLAVSGPGVRILDTSDLTERRSFTFPGAYRVRWHPGASQLAVQTSNRAVVIDATSGRATLKLEKDPMHDVLFSATGERILTAHSDGRAVLWDSASGNLLQVFEGHVGLVRGIAFASGGRRVITSGLDNTVRVWDADRGTQLLQLERVGDRARDLAMSADGVHLATTAGSGRILVRRTESAATRFERWRNLAPTRHRVQQAVPRATAPDTGLSADERRENWIETLRRTETERAQAARATALARIASRSGVNPVQVRQVVLEVCARPGFTRATYELARRLAERSSHKGLARLANYRLGDHTAVQRGTGSPEGLGPTSLAALCLSLAERGDIDRARALLPHLERKHENAGTAINLHLRPLLAEVRGRLR